MKKRIIVLTGIICYMMGSLTAVNVGAASSAEQLARDVPPFEVYEENEYKVEEYRLDEAIDCAIVSGEEFVLGMTYQEIIDKGFVPVDKNFSSATFLGIGKFGDFADEEGSRIELRFHGEEGSTIQDSAVLIGIVHKPYLSSIDTAEMSIGEINTKTSDFNGVLAAFGNPYSIGEESDGSLVLDYKNKDKHQPDICFHIDPETNGIIYMSIE